MKKVGGRYQLRLLCGAEVVLPWGTGTRTRDLNTLSRRTASREKKPAMLRVPT
jgi:hypothetical protein